MILISLVNIHHLKKKPTRLYPAGQINKFFISVNDEKLNLIVNINKLNDDWYYVMVGDSNQNIFPPGEEDIFFKCDTIIGVETLLKEFNWFRL